MSAPPLGCPLPPLLPPPPLPPARPVAGHGSPLLANACQPGMLAHSHEGCSSSSSSRYDSIASWLSCWGRLAEQQGCASPELLAPAAATSTVAGAGQQGSYHAPITYGLVPAAAASSRHGAAAAAAAATSRGSSYACTTSSGACVGGSTGLGAPHAAPGPLLLQRRQEQQGTGALQVAARGASSHAVPARAAAAPPPLLPDWMAGELSITG